tara:strand:+ start:363 stop:1199 length:837 start_codon:yes stop_codon:yes gene_type:complete
MYEVYDRWPEISNTNFNSGIQPLNTEKISHIVFAGMGGSGALSDIFAAILSKTNVHVDVVKGYSLPKTVNSETLVITTSISGNTIETLTVLNSARKMNCKILGFSSGGHMEEICLKNNLEYRKIAMENSPRASFAGFLYSMLRVLENILPLKKEDVDDSILKISKLRNRISSDNLNEKNDSLELAKWITNFPMIYYPWGLQAAAIRFKNSLQENAKIHSAAEDIIETCHNGIVAWNNNSSVMPILIQGKDDFVKTKERWKIVKEFFEDQNIEYKERIF